MNSRERVLRTLEFKETDRVPLDTGGREDDLMKHLNLNSYYELYDFLGIDFRIIRLPASGNIPKRSCNGYEANYWGVPLICESNGFGELCPLSEVSSVDEVETYEWPKVDVFDYSTIAKQMDEYSIYYKNAVVWAPIFHDFTWMCGFENCLMLMMTEPEITKAVLRRITDFWIDVTKRVLDAGHGKIDCVSNCNDFGTQRGLVMSPEKWREFIKPELKRFYNIIKQYGARVFQHSCGSIVEIIPDLIELGADILDPIQVMAENMDPKNLVEKFGGKIVFHGGIDTQHVLPEGNEQEVRAEVRRIIRTLSSKGGYILCGSQGYMEDIPISNIVAMYDEAKKVKHKIII